MRKFITLLFAIILGFGQLWAQQFPITVVPQVNSPTPVNFYNYADPTAVNSPLRVQILLNDISIVNEQIRLKIFFEGNGISFESRDQVIGANSLFIDGGVPLVLNNVDLAPYFEFQNIQGISSNIYGSSIPEGSYQFCFQIFDFGTGNRLSSKSCASAFIFNNDPPLLNLPFNKSNIEPNEVENIVFQWTPRQINVSNVEYELSIVEIWDDTVDPQTAFLSLPPVFQTTTRNTSFLYGPSEPLLLPNKRYAWQVRAKALQGLEEVGLFRNEGKSEVFWFSRTEPCRILSNVYAESKGISKINVFWDQDPFLYSEYTIAYREANKEDAEWFTIRTNSSWATVWGLKSGTTYEYKVQAKCKYQYGDFSEIREITTDVTENEEANYNCGIVPDAIAITNTAPHPGVSIGDRVRAGDFIITLTEITSQSNGRISGRGYVGIPYLKGARFGVNYSNVLINTDGQLAEGEIVTLYDEEFGEDATATVDVNIDIKETLYGSDGTSSVGTVDFEIVSVTVDEHGAYVFTGVNGEQAVIPGGDNVDVIDSQGKVWSVGQDGTVTQEDAADGGPVVVGNTSGLDESGDVSEVSSTSVSVNFNASGYYAYDDISDLSESVRNKLASEYKTLTIDNGDEYQIPYKAISAVKGKDVITADVIFKDTSFTTDDIVFKTKSGIEIPANWEGNTATLSLERKSDYKIEEVVAAVKPKKEGDPYTIAGAFNLTHVGAKENASINLVVVPVNNVTMPSNIKGALNDIYNKAGVHFNISIGTRLQIPEAVWDIDINDQILNAGDSGIFNTYSEEERAINAYFKEQGNYVQDTYYLFMTDLKAVSDDTNEEIDGFMPLKNQFGYVFQKSTNKIHTGAHELGHGVFGLEHPFTKYGTQKGATDFLMDYAGGTTLTHMDWKAIHAPGFKVYWFQDDEAGESSNVNWDDKMITVLDHLKKNIEDASDLIKWREITSYTTRNGRNGSTTNYGLKLQTYKVNLGSYGEVTFELKEQPSVAAEDVKVILGEEKLEFKTNTLETNVTYDLIVSTNANNFVFTFDSHDELESFSNYLKLGRDRSITEPNVSSFSKQIIEYLQTNHLPDNIAPAKCGSIGLYFKEIPADFLTEDTEENLWKYIKALLYPTCPVDEIGVSEEEVLLKLITVLGAKGEAKLLENLMNEKSYSGDLMFTALYSKIDDLYGKDNFTKFINLLYDIWSKTDYATKEAVNEIAYSIEKKFSFFKDSHDISFDRTGIVVQIQEEDQIVANYNGRVNYEKIEGEFYSYPILDPIILIQYDQIKEEFSDLKVSNSKIPTFVLAALAQKKTTDNFAFGTKLAFEVGLTFTGIGNISKLRYLTKLGKLNATKTYALADGITTTMGVTKLLLEYSGQCDTSKDPNATCGKIKEYLTLIEASLSLGTAHTVFLRRKAGELIERIESSENTMIVGKNRDVILTELRQVANLTDREVLAKLWKLYDDKLLTELPVSIGDLSLVLSTVSYAMEYTSSCKNDELCTEIKSYLSYINSAIGLNASINNLIVNNDIIGKAKSIIKKIDADQEITALPQGELIKNEIRRIAEIDVDWRVKLDADMAKSSTVRKLFDGAEGTRKIELEEAYKVLKDFPNIRTREGNLEVLANVYNRFEYTDEKGFDGLNKLIATGSTASMQKLIDGMKIVNDAFPASLPVQFSGIKKGEVIVRLDTKLSGGTGEEIARFVDGRLEKKKIIADEDADGYEVVKSFEDGDVLLRKGDDLGFRRSLRTSSFKDTSYDEFINTVDDFRNGAKQDLAEQAYQLWGNNKWGELEELFKVNKINEFDGVVWPPFNGVKKIIKKEKGSQLIGQVFDRFQSYKSIGGSYASPVLSLNNGVDNLVFTYDNRALSTDIKKGTFYVKFKIKENVPKDLEFEYGEAIPWFGIQGDGQQIKSSKSFHELDPDVFEILELLEYDGNTWIEVN